ncbi:DUF2339 domain-containing protein [Legionella maceachernii]|uniref:DUF2339 domain-containing protein n=1 Tax=Legionella maceachernii TaxID=466 RepID=A0A0W0VZR1_9GAMM|nr:DUF2339 domain-containing protein [Legionella maceachernii]KTD25505.1 hypothetical protein Lmac_1869 [Legionella maceachernii]SJZ54687.1 Predicted membrane protein [Legionella maceachernii]SUP00367.1 Predicted membrane protein [Legionella maceachernii]
MDFSKIEERLIAIEARLSFIESKLELAPQKKLNENQPYKQVESTTKPIQPVRAGNWLGIVAVICFVLAAGFILKLSIQSGWLTPQKQLVFATLFGLALISAGIRLFEFDLVYASMLPAAGAIILYITVLGAYGFYHLITFQTAIVMTSLISGFCIWLYIKINHDLYAIIAALGAFLCPLLLEFDANAIFALYYYIICSLTFATLSIWVQSRTLTVISSYLAISVTSYIGFQLNQDILIAIVLALYYLIFATGTYFHTQLTKKQLTEKEAWSFFPVLLIFYAMEYYFLNRIQPALAPWISLGFAALAIILYLSAKTWFPGRLHSSRLLILTFSTIVAFHSIYLELLPTLIRPWLFVIIVLGFSLYKKIEHPKFTRAFLVPLLALLIILGIEYINILNHLAGPFNLSWLLVGIAAFASVWLVLRLHHDDFMIKDEYTYYFVLGSAHLLGVAWLYQLTNIYGSLAVSASWLSYALCVIGFAFLHKDKIMAKSTLMILTFAAVKALFYDASSTPTIVRILSLMLTGIVLYGSGFLIRKMAGWKS